MKSRFLSIIFLVVFFIGIFVILYFDMEKDNNSLKLIINEVIPNNKFTYPNKDLEYFDIIELYNGSEYDIDLDGYYLSDDNSNLKKFRLPQVMIKSKEYLVIYASGNNYYDQEIHTNFRLDNKGESVILSDNNLNVLSKIKYSETIADTSFGFLNNKYVYFYEPTIMKENSGLSTNEPIKKVKSDIGIKINSYNNKKVELNNLTENDINLDNFYLSSSSKDIYKIHDMVLSSNDSILIDYDIKDSNVITLYSNKKEEIDRFIVEKTKKEIRINEVSATPNMFIELKNLTDKDITLDGYEISDNSLVRVKLDNIVINKNSYYVLDANILSFSINNSNEVLTLYKDNYLVDTFNVSKLNDNISTGINDLEEKVYYKEVTPGSVNSNNYYLGYALSPIYSLDGGYIEKGNTITLKTDDESIIYYTTDGSMPNKNSNKYDSEIKLDKTMTIKAIAYKDDYIESDIISRTFFTRKHTLPIVSISTDSYKLFGSSGIITNYRSNKEEMVNFEFYEKDGTLGTSFISDIKLSGMDSRERNQKSISVYLRKKYGLKEVSYPFFNEENLKTYSSILLRNSGEDPFGIRIMDAVMTKALDNVDIDLQNYRPVVVYLNGEYYGLYNLREKLNSDYVVTKYGYNKDGIDLIKYKTPTHGTISDFNQVVSYILNNDVRNASVYEYIKSKIDIQELINYVIVEAYYGNTDLGNIRYWKSSETGKWRFMLYDLDWSLWNTNISFAYPINSEKVPAATYLASIYNMTKKLYQNSEFRDLYLKTVSSLLKNNFNKEKMNALVDKYSNEIKDEIEYHIARWKDIRSYDSWQNNLKRFKDKLNIRYDTVVGRLRSEFGLSEIDYLKYFGDL